MLFTRTESARRLTSVVGGAAVAAGVLAPMTATSASAASPSTSVVAYLSDDDSHYGGSLLVRPADGSGTPRTLVAESTRQQVEALAVSHDGQRLAYVMQTFSSTGVELRQQLVVRDIGTGDRSRVLVDVAAGPEEGTMFVDPAFSPDGRTVVYGRWPYIGPGIPSADFWRVPADGGVTTRIAGTSILDGPRFTPAGRVLAFRHDDGVLRAVTLPLGGGTSRPVEGGAFGHGFGPGFDLSFSHDGTKVVFSLEPSSDVYSEQVFTAPWHATSTSETVGSRTLLTSVDAYESHRSPTFSMADDKIVAVATKRDSQSGDLVDVPLGGGPVTPIEATDADEFQAVLGTVDSTAPAAVTLGAATLNGTSASIRVTSVLEPDVSGVLVTRTLDGVVQKTDAYLPVVDGVFTDTGLVVGKTYRYAVKPVDRSGNVGPTTGTPKLLTALNLPALTVTDPTSTAVTTTRFPLRLAGPGNPGTTRYDVSYAQAPSGRYASWLVKTTSPTRVFGEASKPVVVAPGTTWTFKGVAFDAHGNSTGVRTSGKAVVPFDQSRASFSGTGLPATSATAADKYLGTTRTLRAPGQRATMPTLTGDRFQVIGERGPSGGTFDVYRGTTRVATKVSTYSPSRKARSVLWSSPVGTTTSSYSVRWVPSGSAGRTNVVLDGFAARK